jgi:hypothetical protein
MTRSRSTLVLQVMSMWNASHRRGVSELCEREKLAPCARVRDDFELAVRAVVSTAIAEVGFYGVAEGLNRFEQASTRGSRASRGFGFGTLTTGMTACPLLTDKAKIRPSSQL